MRKAAWLLAAAIGGLLFLSSYMVSFAAENAPLGDVTPTPAPYYLVYEGTYHFEYLNPNTTDAHTINIPAPQEAEGIYVHVLHAHTVPNGNLRIEWNGVYLHIVGEFSPAGYDVNDAYFAILDANILNVFNERVDYRAQANVPLYVDALSAVTTGNHTLITADFEVYLIVSSPPEPCADVSQLTPITEGNIDATAETGVSESITIGGQYALVLDGGPWHDSPGGPDRYDISITFDGVNWGTLNGYVVDHESSCMSTDPDGSVMWTFTAESDTLTMRVNDAPGAFDDNDGSMHYRLYELSGGGGRCGRYFNGEQWFASGAVPANAEAGGRFPPDAGFGEPLYFTPGQWYKFELAHPWQENDGSDQIGVQIMDPTDGVWINLADWGYTVCADDTVVYFRPNKSEYYIRAADQDGNFSNNSNLVVYNLYTAEYLPPPNPCEGLYDVQNWIDSAVIPASVSSGSPVPSGGERLRGGYYYFLEQTGPQWNDGGVSGYDLEISDDLGQTWYAPEDWPAALCVSHDDQGRYKVYFQANATQIWVRAGDYNGNWADNSGNISYNLYFAGDNAVPPEGSCASEFQLIQDPNTGDVSIVEQGSVPADTENGATIGSDLVSGSWYAIDASMDYWFDNSFPRNEYDLGDNNGNWWLSQNYPGAACAEVVNNQWVRVYFRYQDVLKLRAHDPIGDFSDNTGDVTYRIMPVFHRQPPPPSACYENYELTLVETGKLYANLEQGQELNVTPGAWALETIDPGWTEADGTVSHQVDISDDGGITWYPLEMAPFANCIIATDAQGNYRIYWTFMVSGAYKIRVHDLDNDFGNNQGYIGYLLFSVTETGGTTGTGCDELFTNPELVDSGVVDASNEQGDAINLVPGYWYRIDTSGPAWQNAGVDSWDVALTKDGTNWELVDPNSTLVECAWYPDGVHVRAYFHVQDGDTWKIRAYDPGGYYSDNTGSIQYAIYRVNYQEPVDVPPPPPFALGCDAVCVRPESAINVPAWLEYGACRFIRFISFCPYHEAALSGIMQIFFDREPFATINEIRDALSQIREEINSYNWSSDQQEMGGIGPDDLLAPPPADSPWNGGRIQILGPRGAYNLACQNGLADAVGTQMAKSLCFGLSIVREKGVLGWFQLILDITAIAIGVLYIWKQWIEPAMS